MGKTWFFTVNIAMFIHYFIFIWIFRIVCFFSAGILTICFWQILHAILKVKNDKWPVKEDYLGFRGSNRGSCYISTPTLHALYLTYSLRTCTHSHPSQAFAHHHPLIIPYKFRTIQFLRRVIVSLMQLMKQQKVNFLILVIIQFLLRIFSE